MTHCKHALKLAQHEPAPKAMIVKDVKTVLVVNAFMAKVPLVDRLEKDPLKTIYTGDFVKVGADNSIVMAIRRKTRPCVCGTISAR